jgi:hypothetical protein
MFLFVSISRKAAAAGSASVDLCLYVVSGAAAANPGSGAAGSDPAPRYVAPVYRVSA